MYVVPITFPGTWLEFEPQDIGFQVESLLRNMTSGLAEAAISLGWFEAEQQSHHDPSAEWERSAAIRNEAESVVRARNGGDYFNRDWDRERAEADQVALQIAATRGILPSGYRHQFAFIHARTFLYALDSIAKSLGVLSKTPGVPTGVDAALTAWTAAFPSVQAIRDSAHHMEDRTRGLGRNGKPLSLKSIDNQLAYAPSGALILNALTNSRYGTTTASGDFEEVDVTPDSLEQARTIVQSTVQAFSWRGPVRLEPSM